MCLIIIHLLVVLRTEPRGSTCWASLSCATAQPPNSTVLMPPLGCPLLLSEDSGAHRHLWGREAGALAPRAGVPVIRPPAVTD